MPLISVVVPVYRNAGSLNDTYVSVSAALAGLGSDYAHELLFVDDGSDDGSAETLRDLQKIDSRVRVVTFVRNFGQVAAIQAGYAYATGDLLVNISADMQDSPALIVDMVRKWEEGYKVVACVRAEREDGLGARLTSRAFYGLMRISIPRMPPGGFDYFLLDRVAYRALAQLGGRNAFIQSDILWLGYPPHFIPYRRVRRTAGRSQWTLGKKLKYFIDGLVNASYLPVRLISSIGAITALAGLLYAAVVVVLRLTGRTPFTGYAPIMIVLLVTSGLVMVMLGVVGEYVWRIHDEVRGRPRYIVKDVQP